MSDERAKIYRVLAQVSGVAVEEIEPGMDLVADLGIDSPKALQLMVTLEDTLGIEISDEQVASMETVGDVLAVVRGA